MTGQPSPVGSGLLIPTFSGELLRIFGAWPRFSSHLGMCQGRLRAITASAPRASKNTNCHRPWQNGCDIIRCRLRSFVASLLMARTKDAGLAKRCCSTPSAVSSGRGRPAVYAIIVDAKNDSAVAFYEGYGFRALPVNTAASSCRLRPSRNLGCSLIIGSAKDRRAERRWTRRRAYRV